MSSWFDRPLTVAGRAVVNVKGKIESRLLHIDRDLLVIPNLAIHFNREINNGYKYNPHIDMQPLYGNSGNLLEVMAEHLELEVSQIIDYDLYLVVRQRASKLGVAEEFFMSPRIDDLACAYVSLRSFCKAVLDRKKTSIMPLWCLFDNE